MTSLRIKWAVLLALAFGVVLRLGFGLVYWQGKPLTQDEREYLAYALNLAAGRGFVRDLPADPLGPAEERFARAPLYPAALSILFRATDQPSDRLPASVPRSVQVVQAFVGAITIWLVGVFAARAAGPRAAAIAAWLAAVYPPLVWSCAYALSEAVYSPLILGSALLASTVMDRRPPGLNDMSSDTTALLLAGVLAGAAALTRSAALVFLALAIGWLLVRRGWKLAAVLGLGGVLVVGPWTTSNVFVHGRVIAVAADGGVTFWTGNHPLAIGEGDMAANPQIKADHVRFRRQFEGLSPEAREPYYYRAAFAWIAAHPAQWLGLEARKFFYTWVPIGPSYTLHSPLYYWATLATYVPLLVIALCGVPRLWRSPVPPRALGLVVASTVLVCLIFFPQERFRIPVVDPALCVAAAACLGARDRPNRSVGAGRV